MDNGSSVRLDEDFVVSRIYSMDGNLLKSSH